MLQKALFSLKVTSLSLKTKRDTKLVFSFGKLEDVKRRYNDPVKKTFQIEIQNMHAFELFKIQQAAFMKDATCYNMHYYPSCVYSYTPCQ